MRKLTNVSNRPETIVLATGKGGCYTGRRGQPIAQSVTLVPGSSLPADDDLLETPKVKRLLRSGKFRLESEPPKPKKPKRKSAKKKSTRKTKKKADK